MEHIHNELVIELRTFIRTWFQPMSNPHSDIRTRPPLGGVFQCPGLSEKIRSPLPHSFPDPAIHKEIGGQE